MASKRIEDCCQVLKDAWPKVKETFETTYPGWKMVLTCTHRPPEEQEVLFKQGREWLYGKWVIKDKAKVVTYKDGTDLPSRHNLYPAEAFDVALINAQGDTEWKTELEQWKYLPYIAGLAGIFNGGGWTDFKDYCHFQEKP